MEIAQLEKQLTETTSKRTRLEQLVEDYKIGLGTEYEQVNAVLGQLQTYLKQTEQAHAIDQLLHFVDALKLMAEVSVKIEELTAHTPEFQQVIVALQNQTVVLTQVQTSLAQLADLKLRNASKESDVLDLIKKELTK